MFFKRKKSPIKINFKTNTITKLFTGRVQRVILGVVSISQVRKKKPEYLKHSGLRNIKKNQVSHHLIQECQDV